MLAKQTVSLDADHVRKALRLVELLEDLDDVQRVTDERGHPRGAPGRDGRMIVLGIDPGTAALGYGIVERTGGSPARRGLRVPHHQPGLSLPERLRADPRARRWS